MKKTAKTTKSRTPAKKTKKSAGRSTAAVKKTAPRPVVTTITAQIDVGFGNALYLRGEGPGLSWDKGVPMACVADDSWSATVPESSAPVVCKFLLNDQIWCAGDDFVVPSGSTVTLVPEF